MAHFRIDDDIRLKELRKGQMPLHDPNSANSGLYDARRVHHPSDEPQMDICVRR